MNYLAHIYLSKNNDLLKIGNFIADGVKGKSYLNFPKDIQTGILLHRKIDAFTDKHPIVRQSKKRIFSKYRHYSSVIVDIYYDHFLAKNWHNYSEKGLAEFADNFYTLLKSNFEILPERYQQIYPFMKAQNWLLSYASLEGIQRVFNGMNKRAKHESKMDEAVMELKLHYNLFEQEFIEYFIELMHFNNQNIKEMYKK